MKRLALLLLLAGSALAQERSLPAWFVTNPFLALPQFVPVPFNKGASAGGIALVSASSAVGENFAPATTTISTTGATLIGVCLSWADATATTQAVTDGSGNTYHPITAVTQAGDGATQLFYSYGITTSGSDLITATSTPTGDRTAVMAWAFSGTLTTSSVLDTAAPGPGTAGSTSVQPGSITPAQAGELFLTCASANGAAVGTWTINSGFIAISTTVGFWSGGFGYLINAGSGAINPLLTPPAGHSTDPLEATMAAFKHP